LKKFIKIHFLQLTAKLAQKRHTYVYMKVFKAILANVGIPQSNNASQIEFSQQETIHPFKGKLHKLNAHFRQMLTEAGINPLDDFFQPHDHALHTRLIGGIMILNACQNVGEAPIDIGFDLYIHTYIHTDIASGE
jgi:hypothetical protein